MKESFFYRRLVRPLINLLKQGASPEKLALSIAVGLVLGIFPGVGMTTILCTLAALRFGLNLPAIQLVNYFVYPLQLVLLIPFIRAGELLFHSARLPLSLSQILAMIRTDGWRSLKVLGWATAHAMTVWLLLAPPAMFLIYRALLPVMRRLAKATGILTPESPAETEIA